MEIPMQEFQKTDQNRIKRLPDRGHYDAETIYQILDEALLCYVGFIDDGQAFVIPTNHARLGDTLYLHGAKASRMLKLLQAGNPVCITTAIIDGIVFARSVFNHSINYRSVVLFGHGRLVSNDVEKLSALEAITNHIAPGRWADARLPSQKELDSTTVVAVEIESASAKVRGGPPKDGEEDCDLPVWAGVLPLALEPGSSEPETQPKDGPSIPQYVLNYNRKKDLKSEE
jgi:hypothetical protein